MTATEPFSKRVYLNLPITVEEIGVIRKYRDDLDIFWMKLTANDNTLRRRIFAESQAATNFINRHA